MGAVARLTPRPAVKRELQVGVAPAAELLPLRARFREEMNCQIVHDSIHRREGWAVCYRLGTVEHPVGFGTVAIGGPWAGKPTVYEFWVVPEERVRLFDWFEAFLEAAHPSHFEVQTNEPQLAVLLHAYGRHFESEKIVFRDGAQTQLPAHGARVRGLTSAEEIRRALANRQGGGDWVLELDGQRIASGGVLFHYNVPYGDVYMEVDAGFRRRGFGSYLVQELKRECYALGAIPAARCNPGNIGSRTTLQRAGFVPSGHIVNATIDWPRTH